MPEIAYVNGKFVPLDQAMVHVEDRGFQFADSVYEVLRTYGGELFAIDEHLARLSRSLAAIELSPGCTTDQLASLVRQAVRLGGFAESVVYIQISRGRVRRHRAIPSEYQPTLVLTVRELKPPRQLQETGLTVITIPDNRWERCDIKSVALLPNVLAYHAAHRAGVQDAIFVGADGTVFEATAGNVFAVNHGRLRTPPTGPKLLAGVTRSKILEAARAAGVPVAEERVTRDELQTAEEVFLTSTTGEVLPVVAVDGKRIGQGKPGPVTDAVYQQFLRQVVRR